MFDVVKRTVQAYGESNGPLLAAAMAYYGVLSLAPILLLLTSILVFVGAGDAQATVMDEIRNVLGEDGAAMLDDMIRSQAERGGGALATIVGSVALLLGATTLFAQLERALNIVWGVEPRPGSTLGSAKHLAMQRVRSLGLIAAIGGMLLLVAFLSTYVSAAIGAAAAQLPGGGIVWSWVNRLFAFAILTGAFAIVFTLLPNATVPRRAVLIGAPATAALFVLATWGFGVYVTNVALESAYGAAGSLVALLLWVFVSAHAVLLGAAFTKVVANVGGEEHGLRRATDT